MSGVEFLVLVAILVGLVGVIVPILPGALLVLAAILFWAVDLGETGGWIVFSVATTFLAVGAVAKYLIPGRRLAEAGIPGRTQWIGVAFGVVGFFVVPVIGLFIGFVLGMYVAERARVGAADAWPSTKAGLRAVGLSILIELASAVLAAGVWVVGVVLT